MNITTGYRGWADLQDERNRESWLVNILATFAAMVAFAVIFGALFSGCANSIDQTAKKSRKPEPVYVAHYYDKPAAFRLSTPTQAQMDHLHALLVVDQVRHPERMDTDVY